MKTLSVLLFLIFFVPGNTRAGEMVLASEEWPPYAFTDNGVITGYSTEIIKAVFGRLGVMPKIRAYPWARAEELAIWGKVDGLYSASREAKRETACHYPEEKIFDSEYIFFINRKNEGKLSFIGFDDLKGKKIGVTRAYSYNERLWNFLRTNKNYREAPTDEINFKLLAEGRIDYFPAEKGNGFALLKKMNLTGKITFIDNPFVQKPYYLIFNKKNVGKKFVDKFGNELKAFKTTPEFKAIRQKYFE